jgi:nitrite reductase (NADH) small subunit
MYKQHFVLATGVCLEDEQVTLKTYPVKIDGDDVLIAA